MAWLLDTNILSEIRKGKKADAKVRQWFHSIAGERAYISVLSLGEIRKGIELLKKRSPQRYAELEQWLNQIQELYEEDILPVSEDIADQWGRMTAQRTLPVIDELLAATAVVHRLTLATRNIRDFQGCGVRLFNPFE